MGWTDANGQYHESADEQSNRAGAATERARAAAETKVHAAPGTGVHDDDKEFPTVANHPEWGAAQLAMAQKAYANRQRLLAEKK